jgi:hypothetical protein
MSLQMYKASDLCAALVDPMDQDLFRQLFDSLGNMEKELSEYDRACLRMLLHRLIERKPQHRPEDKNLWIKKGQVYLTLRWLTSVEGWKKHAAKVECAHLYGIGKSSVEAYEREIEEKLHSAPSSESADYTAMLAESVLKQMSLCDNGQQDDPNYKAVKQHCLVLGPSLFKKNPTNT